LPKVRVDRRVGRLLENNVDWLKKLIARYKHWKRARDVLDTCGCITYCPHCNDILNECYGTLGSLVQERDRLLRGEYICKQCGLRKNSERSADHEF